MVVSHSEMLGTRGSLLQSKEKLFKSLPRSLGFCSMLSTDWAQNTVLLTETLLSMQWYLFETRPLLFETVLADRSSALELLFG